MREMLGREAELDVTVDPDLIGPGRVHPSGEPTVPRNSPTTFNVALWDKVLFWDGRVESLGKTPGANGNDGLGIRTPDSRYGIADPQAGEDLVIAQSRFPVTSGLSIIEYCILHDVRDTSSDVVPVSSRRKSEQVD